MQPKFQTSFIPKKAVEGDSSRGVRAVDDTNIFTLAGTLVFLSTVLLFGGLFLYKNLLLKQLEQKGNEVIAAKSAIEPDKIREILDANSRITASVDLLNNHLVTSKLLSLLGELAVKNLQFNDLKYENKANGPTILINGEVKTYNSLAFQNETLSKNELLKKPVFSEINLLDSGNIKFRFSAVLDHSLVSYKKLIESLPIN